MSFVAQSRPRVSPVLPMAAMLDILFLLLVFFMTISTVRDLESRFDVQLPGAATGDPLASVTPLNIEIRADGRLLLNRSEHDRESMLQTLRALASRFPHEVVYVRGDRLVTLETLTSVMDLARQAGFANIAIVNIPADAQER